jgi:acetyl esterase/lipase
MDQVRVRSEGSLDIYTPAGAGPFPVVVIVAGYRDEGFRARLGCSFQQMQSTVSWAQLIAASGIAAVTYTNHDPAADFLTVLRTIREHAAAWHLDAQRIGLWSSSGNVPVALSALMRDSPERVLCAALLYGCTLDLDGHTGIADASRLFGFANPVAGRAFDDLRPDVPLFIARAGRDQTPGLNDAMDRFVGRAVAGNLPMTFVNHGTGVHAFDLFDDSAATREVIRQVLAFLQFQLTV